MKKSRSSVTAVAWGLLVLFCAVAPAQTVFDVTTYGATGDGVTDDAPAIQAAIAAAVAAGPNTKVFFPEGTYRSVPVPSSHNYTYLIENAQQLTLEGDSAKIVIAQPPYGVFFFENADQCVVRGLTIDFDPLPFTQGTITATDEVGGTFDVTLHTGFPSLNESWFFQPSDPWGMIFDSAERHIKDNTNGVIRLDSWFEVSGGANPVFRITPDTAAVVSVFMEVGDRWVHPIRTVGGHAMLFRFSSECLVEDVTLHASSDLAIATIGCDSMTFRRYNVEFPSGTDRLLTANGDAIHCQANFVGPLVEECLFEGMGDDGINVHGISLVVTEVESTTSFIVSLSGWARHFLSPGDRIQVFNFATGTIRGTAAVTQVEEIVPFDSYRVRVDTPVTGVQAGSDVTNADVLLNLDASGEGFIIRNNTMRWHRMRGVIVRAGQGLIENNTIEGLSGVGIQVSNDPAFGNGPGPDGVMVRNNTVTNVGYAAMGNFRDGGAIQVIGMKLGQTLSADRIITNVTLWGNEIHDWRMTGIYGGAVDGLDLVHNIIGPSNPAAPTADQAVAVYLEHCDNVTIHDLEITDLTRTDLRAGVELTASMPADSVTMHDLNAALAAGVPEVIDVAGALRSGADLPDTDGDGLLDWDEDANGNGVWDAGEGETDWENADSDDDGVDDGTEAAWGTNPLDGGDFPVLPLKTLFIVSLFVLSVCIVALRKIGHGTDC